MSTIAYVNGHYVPHHEAAVHVEDRGYQFSDGVYEVIAVCGGCTVDGDEHLDRLERSLDGLTMDWPMSRRALGMVIGEVIRRNRLGDGYIYLQVTRGVARREHFFPKDTVVSLVITARRSRPVDGPGNVHGVSVITTSDIRWKRCDIKSISLLPNVLIKQQARQSGAFEAWMVDDQGLITEGAASNAWIVTAGGELVTRDTDRAVLSGITRRAVMALARDEGVSIVERPFTVDEAKSATEAFLTSTTSLIKPVVKIDGEIIGEGKPGPLFGKLAALYANHFSGQGGRG